ARGGAPSGGAGKVSLTQPFPGRRPESGGGRPAGCPGRPWRRRFPRRAALALTLLGAAAVLRAGAEETTPAPGARLPADVVSLFQARCVRCHGGKAPKGELDLRTLAGALKGGESGPAVFLGKPDESPLLE